MNFLQFYFIFCKKKNYLYTIQNLFLRNIPLLGMLLCPGLRARMLICRNLTTFSCLSNIEP